MPEVVLVNVELVPAGIGLHQQPVRLAVLAERPPLEPALVGGLDVAARRSRIDAVGVDPVGGGAWGVRVSGIASG